MVEAGGHQGPEGVPRVAGDTAKDTNPATGSRDGALGTVKVAAPLEVNLYPTGRAGHDEGGEDEGGRPKLDAIGPARPPSQVLEQEDLPVPQPAGRGTTITNGETCATRPTAQGRPLVAQTPLLSEEVPVGDGPAPRVAPPVGRRPALVRQDTVPAREGVPEVEGPIRRQHGS